MAWIDVGGEDGLFGELNGLVVDVPSFVDNVVFSGKLLYSDTNVIHKIRLTVTTTTAGNINLPEIKTGTEGDSCDTGVSTYPTAVSESMVFEMDAPFDPALLDACAIDEWNSTAIELWFRLKSGVEQIEIVSVEANFGESLFWTGHTGTVEVAI